MLIVLPVATAPSPMVERTVAASASSRMVRANEVQVISSMLPLLAEDRPRSLSVALTF